MMTATTMTVTTTRCVRQRPSCWNTPFANHLFVPSSEEHAHLLARARVAVEFVDSSSAKYRISLVSLIKRAAKGHKCAPCDADGFAHLERRSISRTIENASLSSFAKNHRGRCDCLFLHLCLSFFFSLFPLQKTSKSATIPFIASTR